MYKKALLLSLIVTGGCANAINSSVQEIEFTTPGANNAVCYAYIDKIRYRIRPPQTISVHKSGEDMKVDCLAPGNRRRTIYIEPGVDNTSAWNLANAGVGYVYDYASGAMFNYPARVVVDFTGTEASDMPLPAQNQPDIRQPESYDLEEFSPSSPRLNSDKDALQTRILRRGEDPYGNMYGEGEAFSEMPAQGKGDLMEENPYASPRSGQQAAPSAGPVPLIPGE